MSAKKVCIGLGLVLMLVCVGPRLGAAEAGPEETAGEQKEPQAPEKGAEAGVRIDTSAYRIGISSDGNLHDADDIGASAMALAMIGEAGLQAKLVHHDYNCHLGKSSENREKEMAASVLGAADRWGIATTALFDDQKDLAGAAANIARQINASSEKDRLYLCAGGPMEVVWRGINASDNHKRKFCTVISHSAWNDKHADTPQMKHTWNDIRKSGVETVKITDQNRRLNSDYADWAWLKESDDAQWKWLHSRCESKKTFDVSDAGMVWFVITGRGDQAGDPAKVRVLFTKGPGASVAPPATDQPTASDQDAKTPRQKKPKDDMPSEQPAGVSDPAAPRTGTIVLKAASHDGKDKCWTKRSRGNSEMGIVGSHKVESGNIWFDSFPGETGKYRVGFRVVTENDGHPLYRISAGGTEIAKGSLPLPEGNTLGKGKAYADRVLDLGVHEIKKGDKINVWAQSVYPMSKSHGAYCRWSDLQFTPVE